MNSREIVRRTITFEDPERIGMSLPDPYPNDFCFSAVAPDPGHPPTDWRKAESGWERTDEWGNTWARIEGFSKGEVARGAIEDWDQLDEIELPDYDLPERYEGAAETFRANPEKFKVGHIPGFPFNVARKMRRLDNFLMDVMVEPEKCERLLAMVEERMNQAIRHLAAAGADAIMFAEDWGTQDQLFVPPDIWRRMFRPGFERLCATAHAHGIFVIMHSCGYLYEVIDDMIATGIEVFQFDQPQLYGIDTLAEEFGSRTTFWSPVDIQKTLQTRDPELIEADAKAMIELLGAGGGGFIAGYYGGNEAIGLEAGVQDVACRAFVKYGAPELWEDLKDRLAPAGAD